MSAQAHHAAAVAALHHSLNPAIDLAAAHHSAGPGSLGTPGATGTPTPAVTTPPPAPFLTPAQQQALNSFLTGNTQALIDMDHAFAQMAAHTHEQAGNMIGGALDHTGLIYQQMLHSTASANDSLIARGLGQSSIRDGALTDIETTASMRRQSLLTALSLQQAANDRTRANLDAAKASFQSNMNTQAVQNAQDLPVTPDSVLYTPGQAPDAATHTNDQYHYPISGGQVQTYQGFDPQGNYASVQLPADLYAQWARAAAQPVAQGGSPLSNPSGS